MIFGRFYFLRPLKSGSPVLPNPTKRNQMIDIPISLRDRFTSPSKGGNIEALISSMRLKIELQLKSLLSK